MHWGSAIELAVGAGAVIGLVWFLFTGPDETPPKQPPKQEKPQAAEKLDVDDLDPEERKLLEEVSKKGYYHGRPKSSAAPPPRRLDGQGGDMADGGPRRTEFDDFQKKWDRFGDEKFLKQL
mmetsp:Transcript_53056/g.119563  ORF Transcript_53056/g.119563 Transcript_53056/m.119563 type:complete len:121 (-) Transcript_53056:80-442(-)